jgi:hypothetical protein
MLRHLMPQHVAAVLQQRVKLSKVATVSSFACCGCTANGRELLVTETVSATTVSAVPQTGVESFDVGETISLTLLQLYRKRAREASPSGNGFRSLLVAVTL